ncbi:MAG: hypothetical protein U1F16_10830 [Turneriella sp.]
MLIDATGAHFTAGSTATTGTLTATIAGISARTDILVYVPPAVASLPLPSMVQPTSITSVPTLP